MNGDMSADYQKMYYIMCDGASRALDALPDLPDNRPARELLENALLEAEEMYIDSAGDARLAELLSDLLEREGTRYMELNERLLKDPSAAVPEELDRKCLELIERMQGKRKK